MYLHADGVGGIPTGVIENVPHRGTQYAQQHTQEDAPETNATLPTILMFAFTTDADKFWAA
jgi:hypothetical protein